MSESYDVLEAGQESPYGIYGRAPALHDEEFFLEDYVLAQEIASTLNIDISSTETKYRFGGDVRSMVAERIDGDISDARTLAVSALAVKAKSQQLRRPQERNAKALRHDQLNPFSLMKYRRLRKEEYVLATQQAVCAEISLNFQTEFIERRV